MAARERKKSNETEADLPVFRIKNVFLIIVVLLLLLALFSHNPSDTSVLEGGCDAPIRNWIGEVGAHLSRVLFYLFGIAIYPIIFILIICGFRSFIDFPTRRKGYLGALLTVIIGVTMLFAMWPEEFCSTTASLGIGREGAPKSALSGGVIGQQLSAPASKGMQAGIVREYIGGVGTAIVAVVFLATGMIFIYLADWHALLVVWYTQTPLAEEPSKSSSGRSSRRSKSNEPEKKNEDEDGDEDEDGVWHPRARESDEALEEESPPEPQEEEEPPTDEQFPQVEESDEEVRKGNEEDIAIITHKEDAVKDSTSGMTKLKQVFTSDEFVLPPISLLEKVVAESGENNDFIEESKRILQSTMESFKVDGKVTGIITGPRVTRLEVSLAPGVKVDKIVSIERNIAMELEAESIRTLAPIPGRNAVGIEVPNLKPSAVYLRAMMESSSWKNTSADIPVVLGKDVAGKPIVTDLAKSPHLLIAGATGSGKSVCMNTLIMSLLFRFSPNDLRLIMVDPKVVELEMYKTLPHLITPVVNEPQKVPLALRWGVNEMEKRYRILAKAKVKNLKGFNSRPPDKEVLLDDEGEPIPATMPYLVIIVDELADVMMTDAKSDVETSIARIAQKGRASGIHIVIATQRPSTNIITGVIKANLPTRIAFRVGSLVDSRVILDQKGAEKLLGRGDMLFIPPGSANLERIQGAMVDDLDIQNVVKFVSDQAEQVLDESVISVDEQSDEEDDSSGSIKSSNSIVEKYLEPGDGDLIRQSLEIIIEERKASTSYLQRRLKIGYNRAAEIIDLFEKRGLVSPPLPGGSKRNILIFDEIENDPNK